MPQTPNHGYNVPDEGAQDWHVPLNENFQQYDTDIEVRDTDGNKGNYDPKQGAKFLATDTGIVYVGDGQEWLTSMVLPRYDDDSSVALGDPSNSVANGASVGGGKSNTAEGAFATVPGGFRNSAGPRATVGGGTDNDATGSNATVGGGKDNAAGGEKGTVGGGTLNEANSRHATVAGGAGNVAGEEATVGGGVGNVATGTGASVPGGSNNEASGAYSFAAGRQATATHGGSFVWADSTDAAVSSTDPDQFLVEAAGGIGLSTDGEIGLGTADPDTPVDIAGQNNWNLDNGDGDVRIGDENYRLAIGVALGGAGAGNVALRAKGGENLHLGAGKRRVLSVQADEDYKWDSDKIRPVNFVGIGTDNRIGDEVLRARSVDSTGAEMVLDVAEPLGENVAVYSYAVDGTVEASMSYSYDGEAWIVSTPNGRIRIKSDGDVTIDNSLSVLDDLDVGGNKNFVQPVDTGDGEKEVVYTSTEAPTPRTEASGVAEFDDGRAEIDLPEHFGWVTDEAEPLHVQTTPYSADSGGLAVVERSTDRIVVEDLDGDGDYEFSYTVRGTRDGYADKEVVREPSASDSEERSPAQADD